MTEAEAMAMPREHPREAGHGGATQHPAPGMMSGPGMPGMMPGQMMPGFMPGVMLPGVMPGAVMGGTMVPGTLIPGMIPGQVMPGMIPGISMPGFMPGTMGPGMIGGDGMTPEEREKKLTQLRSEISDFDKVEKIQYDIDGLQQKVFEIESKVKSTTQFDEFLNSAKEQLDKYPILRRLPEKIDERLDRYKDLFSLQADEVEKIDQGALKYDDEYRFLVAVPPLYKQQLFLTGIGLLVGGIIFFAASSFIEVLKYLSVASFAGIGITFWVSWQYISQTGRKNDLEKKLKDLDEKKQGVVKRFQVEMAVIEKLMEDTDSETSDELKLKIQKYRDLDGRYQSVADRKKKLIKELNIDALLKQEKELKAQIAEMEKELRKYPAFSMDVNEMRKEIKRLEDVIRQTNPASTVLKSAAPAPTTQEEGFGVPDLGGPAGPGTVAVHHPGESGSTRAVRRRSLRARTAPQAYEQMLQSAALLLSTERNQLVSHMQQRFNLYIQALFAKRYSEARIDPDGSIALKSTEGNRWVDFDKLTPAARDTGFLALQITMLELATQKRILPVILDNAALRLDETAGLVAGKAFKRVSERTQVVFLSAQRGPLQFADNSLNLM
jgi:hypothetical protein